MNCCHETVKMGVSPGNRRVLDPNRTWTVPRRVRHPRKPGFRLGEKDDYIHGRSK